MREAHYIKRNNSKEYPRHCLFVDTETLEEIVSKTVKRHHLNFGWCCYRRRGRNHQWGKEEWHHFKTIKQFWKIVDKLSTPKTCLTMFAHNWAFDAPVLDTFNYLFKHGWELKSAVIDSPPIIIKYRKDDRSIKLIDTLNFYRMPLAKVGKHIGTPKLKFPAKNASKKVWDTYCKQDVIVIMKAMLAWFDYIRAHQLGGFGPTLASQAMRGYRHRFMDHDILIDDDDLALSLARDAYHGGRTECFRIGNFKGPFYYLDVNSMYPFVMRNNDYPSQLVAVYEDVSKKELREWLKEFCVVASVIIKTEQPVYSIIKDERLIFPVGTFETTLTTRELLYAQKHKHIFKIKQVVIYKKARIFKKYVDYFYRLKQAASKSGDVITATLTKLFLNCLYGKFGQRGRFYEYVENTDTLDMGSWSQVDYKTRDIVHFRKFGGMVQSMVEEGESRDSHPAIAAHVTADSRLLLWDLYQQAGTDNLYYSDTDSIIVNKKGYAKLKHLIHPDKLGMLKLEKTIQHACIYGPKDYQFDDDIVVKGVKKKAKWLDENTVRQEQWLGLKGLLASGDMSAPVTKLVTKKLSRLYTKGQVNRQGVVSPFRLNLWDE